LDNKVIGRQGEAIALNYLIKNHKSYRLLVKNFTCKLGEIDLIFFDGDEIVFTEVKTRRNKSYGMPYEAVTASKMTKIRRIAEYYLMVKNITGHPIRFDVVSIILEQSADAFEIEHIIAAF